jgi:ketosteroid isomerase-like protein
MTHVETIESFYRAFQQRDYEGMTACYHPSIHFSDPVFPDLHGDEARAMWHMLCEQGTDLRVTFTDVTAEGDSGGTHWDAHYTFSPTGRLVHNKVDARFEFEDGKIIRHVDSFNLWRWTRMALGTTGVMTGWSGFAQAKVRATADSSLRRFIAAHPDYTVPAQD